MVELSKAVQDELIQAALAVRANAYAPFSGFHVGSAVLDEQGRVFAGANVENSSYGLTICAERTAAGAAISNGAKRISAVAVATPGAAAPCGACRQFLYEFSAGCVALLVDSDTGLVVRHVRLDELLPNGFRLGVE